MTFHAFSGIRLSLSVTLAGLLLLGMCGCSDNPFDMAPVSGKVTYDDGSVILAARIRVLLYPQGGEIDLKTHPKFAAAEVNVADGTFAFMETWKPKDGAVVGRHKVAIISYDTKGRETDAVPAKYRKPDTSGEEREVKSGQNHFEFKVKKPS